MRTGTVTRSLVLLLTAGSFVAAGTYDVEPCLQVSQLAAGKNKTISAELAYQCMISVPFNQTNSEKFSRQLRNIMQFQSDLEYIKNPPRFKQDTFEAFDVLAAIDEVIERTQTEYYKHNYQWEVDLRILLNKLHDGHVSLATSCLEGAFTYFHDLGLAAYAETPDDIPKVYAQSDTYDVMWRRNGTDLANKDVKASAIKTIEKWPVNEYLARLGKYLAIGMHTPDAQWNAMLASRQAGSFQPGYFTIPGSIYLGPSFTVKWENGTEKTIHWKARVTGNFTNVKSGLDWYNKRCLNELALPEGADLESAPESPHKKHSGKKNSGRSLAPRSAGTEDVLGREEWPPYPPTLVKTKSGVARAYTFDFPGAGKTGVLVIENFLVAGVPQQIEYQDFLTSTISAWKEKGVKRVVIDVTGNNGGAIVLGYETVKQFLPRSHPAMLTNMRATPALETLFSLSHDQLTNDTGSTITKSLLGKVSPSFWNAWTDHDSLSTDGKPFKDWQEFFGPIERDGDNYTAFARGDLSLSDAFGGGVNITDEDNRNRTYEQPWADEDLVILSNGLCASTCSIFSEAMYSAGIKTFTFGGRPAKGPMETNGGVEGQQIQEWSVIGETVEVLKEAYPKLFKGIPEMEENFPPGTFDVPINVTSGSLNLRNGFRNGTHLPLQWVYTPSDCRIQPTLDMVWNVTTLWEEVAERVWGAKKTNDCCGWRQKHEIELDQVAMAYEKPY